MGQDDSCGICGKHYQTCKHFLKSHFVGSHFTLCGASTENYVRIGQDVDEEDICKNCQKIISNLAKKDFQQFLYIMGENS